MKSGLDAAFAASFFAQKYGNFRNNGKNHCKVRRNLLLYTV